MIGFLAATISLTRGRVTLINSVLDSIPTYFMSLFPMPAKVQNHLDKIRRDFLWEGNSKDHKFHLAKWAKVTMPKQFGGLGIKTWHYIISVCL